MCNVYVVQCVFDVQPTNIFTIHMDRTNVCFSCRFRYSVRPIDFLFIRKKKRGKPYKQTAWDLIQWRIKLKKKNCALFYHWMCVIETNTRIYTNLAKSLSHFAHQKFVFFLVQTFFTISIYLLILISCLSLSSYYQLTHVFFTFKHKLNAIRNISQ